MDKNSITGFILIAVVLIAFSWWNQPSAEEQAEWARQDSIARVEKMAMEKAQKAAEEKKAQERKLAEMTDSTALFFAAKQGESRKLTLKNSKVELVFDTHGGIVKEAKVLGYESLDSAKDVTLFDEKDQNLNIMLSGKTDNIITQDLFFEAQEVSDSTVTMRAEAGNGGTLTITYTLPHDSYLLRMSIRADGLSGMFAPNCETMDIDWQERCRQQERGFSFENRYASLTYKKAGKGTDYLNEGSEKTDEQIENTLDWVAFKDQFFSVVLISKQDFAPNALMTSIPQDKSTHYLKQYRAKLKTFFDPTGKQPTELEMFFGPNNYRMLQKVSGQTATGKELDLQDIVYLGWPIVRWINRFFTLYVFDWLTGMNIPMGIVLIIITLLLKFITYPMVKKSYMSSAKMRVLKPKLDEATKQYDKPEDAMQKQQAMMQLYSQYGVSPLSGCLPMLIQMPIWIAMFNFVPNAIELRRESFLWISDLSTYDPIVTWDADLWLIGDHLSLTCILFCLANVLYSVMNMRQQKDQMVGQQAEQMKMMQWMMYLMPVMFFFIFNDYSSGLNFYYFVSLFFSAAIMWLLRKTTDDAKLLAILEARYKENKNNPQKKMSGMAARLQAMQKQAEEMQRQQKRR